jgi:hypothetical protein
MEGVRPVVLAIVFTCLCIASPPAAAQTVESAYSALDLDKCKHMASKQEEDYGEWCCNGYAGIAVHVSFGRNAKRKPAARQTLASFNDEGKKIEWRAERGAGNKLKPFAAIMRWSTMVSSGDEPAKGEVLVVTRLAPGSVC